MEDTIEIEFENERGTVYTLKFDKLRPSNQERIVEMLEETEDPDMDPPQEHEPYEDCGYDRKYER